MLQVSLFRDLSPDGSPLPQSARTWASYSRKLDPIDSQSMKTIMTMQKSLKKILMTNLQQKPDLQRRLQPMKEQIETTAETVEEAIEIALRELDVERHQIEVNVVNEGKSGVLGIGTEEAKVIVSIIDSPSDEILEASLIIESLIDIMGVDVTHSLLEESDQKIDCIFFLNVNKKTIIERIEKRKIIEKRSDDELDTILKRYDTYIETTKPVLNFYSKNPNYYEIDGALNIDEIAAKIDAFLNV